MKKVESQQILKLEPPSASSHKIIDSKHNYKNLESKYREIKQQTGKSGSDHVNVASKYIKRVETNTHVRYD